MHIHILGICGKFMAGLAMIAQQKGFHVTGSDVNTTGPLADMLNAAGISISKGYAANSLPTGFNHVIIGNALSRGVPIIEQILNENIPYYSGPAWLYEHVLKSKWVIAVAGTHGKTTTTSMIIWILEQAGFNPGFLVGGNPNNFATSARYSDSNFFVIEADEYDTAFFDKRSKFIHYNPRTLIINNLEFDHADIFNDLDDIKRQFKHLLRIVPQHGVIIAPSNDNNVQAVLAEGVWSDVTLFGARTDFCYAEKRLADGSEFDVFFDNKNVGTVSWTMVGDHNINNALAALVAVRHMGILPSKAIEALKEFKGVKRRLELRGRVNDISVYDDFAHHPTAIATTLAGLRQRVGFARIFAVVEFASNTMRAGYHEQTMPHAFDSADDVIFLQPHGSWRLDNTANQVQQPTRVFNNVDQIINYLLETCQPGDHIVCMSNHHFDGIHEKLLAALDTN